MTEHYTYLDIYGVLLNESKDRSEITYFITECKYYTLYKWMYQHGWNLVDKKQCKKNGIREYKVTFKK
jgi:hypothetical protein